MPGGIHGPFRAPPNLVIEVRERANLQEMTTFKRRFYRYDLVILDELGYVRFDKASSEILFNLLSTRNLGKKNLRPKKPMGPKPDENSLPPIWRKAFRLGYLIRARFRAGR